jgi:exopolyphosphatase/guanosine-5'-triphosphate,3'-diphosphate pyrophosphatase
MLINAVEADDSGHEFKKLAYLRVPIRLGDDVFIRHQISDAKAGLLLEAMRGFDHLMRAYAVSGFRACATSAMREAANGEELVRTIREKTGIGVEIISGAQEAELIYAAGALGKKFDDDEACLYVDVGGGSTELVVYADRRLRFHDSFQIGTVRMLSHAVEEAETARFAGVLQGISKKYAPAWIVASGGNINKAHKMLGKAAGETIRLDELEALCASLRPRSFDERMEDFGLNDYRADVIVPALDIFVAIGKACASLRGIYVPKVGLADGLIRSLRNKPARGNNKREHSS